MLWHLLGRVFGKYAVLARLLRRYDIFHFFFDGGYLRRTQFRWLQIAVIPLAGKMVVALPYGSDVAVPSRVRTAIYAHIWGTDSTDRADLLLPTRRSLSGDATSDASEASLPAPV